MEYLHPAGLVPLSVPFQVWVDISIDFVEGLPTFQGKNALFLVVDRFFKYAYFIPLVHPYTTVIVAKLFFDHIFKLHGFPEFIVCDCDVVFTSLF